MMEPWTTAFSNDAANLSTSTFNTFTATTTGHHAMTAWPTIIPAPPFISRVGITTLVFSIISCVLSILGCIGILCVFMNFSALRSTSKKLLMYLTIADFFTAAGNLAGIIRYILYKYVNEDTYDEILVVDISCDDPGLSCKIQSFITTSSSLMSFFWMMVISSYFHLSIIRGNTTSDAEKLMWLCHVCCWGIPVAIVSYAAGLDILGEDKSYSSGSWCWITVCPDKYPPNNPYNTISSTWWMFISGKFFEILAYLMLIINYTSVKIILLARRRARILRDMYNSNHTHEHWAGDIPSQNSDESSEDGIPVEHLHPGDVMFIYAPIIMLVLRIWGTIKVLLLLSFTTNYIEEHLMDVERILTFLQGVGDSGQGFMNFVLFCMFTEEVRLQIVDWYRRPSSSNRNRSVQYDVDATLSRERVRRLVGTYNKRLPGNPPENDELRRTSANDASFKEESDETTPLLSSDHQDIRQIQTEPPSKGKQLFKARQFDYTVS